MTSSPPLVDTPEARDELECPRCGYSLRGLSGPAPSADGGPSPAHSPWTHCPECGHRCEWQKLLRARHARGHYLFEHHPERNLWSYFRTLFAALRPRRFWSALDAGHPVRPGRLALYWACNALTVLASCVAGWYAAELLVHLYERLRNPAFFAGPPPRLLTFFQVSDLEFSLALVGVAWPWVSLAALLLFHGSTRRARLRTRHVLRCVVYSGDVFVWVGALAVVTRAALLAVTGVGTVGQAGGVRLAAAQTLVLAAAATYRLAVAYRRYLRFDHAVATVLASQVVVVLFLLVLFATGARQFYWFFL